MSGIRVAWVLVGLFLSISLATPAAERPPFPNVRYPTGIGFVRDLVTADFNEDALPDIAVVSMDGAVVMLGGGPEVLSAPLPFPAAGKSTLSVATADLDQDGHLDLATVGFGSPGSGSSEVTIALGNGDGTFDLSASYPTPDLARSIAIGDLDSDGIDDLAMSFVTVSSSDPGIAIRLGNGDGTFGLETVLPVGAGRFVGAARLDADAHCDLIATEGPDILVLLSDGLGGFAPPVSYFVNTMIFDPPTIEKVVAVDLDGDTAVDLVASAGTGLGVMMGAGDGTFTQLGSYPGGAEAADVVDLDGDGILDVIVADYISVLVHRGFGGGNLAAKVRYPSGGAKRAVHVADLDTDGKLDVVVDSGFDVEVLFGNGDGTLESRTASLPFQDGQSATSRLIGDIDLDGFEDLTRGDFASGQEDRILFGAADGTFTSGPAVSGIGGQFTSDGLTDLLDVELSSLQMRFWINLGNRTFPPVPVTKPAAFDGARDPVAVDLNGDSRSDLVVANHDSNEISVLLGVADATLGPDTRYAVGAAPSALIVKQLSPDTFFDIAVANRDSDNISVLIGSGGASFQPAVSYPVGDAPSVILSDDLNGDGASDLVVINEDSYDVSVLLGVGDGTFGLETRYPFEISGVTPLFLDAGGVLADFDRDGHVDLLVDEVDGGTLWGGNGDGTLSLISRLGFAGSIVSDFDEDGWPDTLRQNNVFFNLAGPGMLGFESDRNTMRWPGVASADAYNLYRGDMAGFTDFNLDGLADGGYGVCLSALDPDTTDTLFTDTDVPAIGGDGYFYLRSSVTGGSESDLGSTSGGLNRIPDILCP